MQFDIRHATLDGAEAWPKNLDLIHKYLGSITIKDFHWEKKAGKWATQNVPAWRGMIDFKKYFRQLKQYDFKNQSPSTLSILWAGQNREPSN